MTDSVASSSTRHPTLDTRHSSAPRIAITLGDPNGVGPEVVLKSLSDARMRQYFQPLVVGSLSVVQQHAEKLGWNALRIEGVADAGAEVGADVLPVLDTLPGETVDVEWGQITETGGRLAMRAVEVAVDLCREGQAGAVVTAPISKEAISMAGYKVPGHTEFIADRVGAADHTMMMVADDLRVGLVTGHMPIWDVPKGVTLESILARLRTMARSLRADFGIERPKIAVLGLNPHAGDGGVLGREEIDSIIPAIKAACDEGILTFGPFPADGFFAIGAYRVYDAVLAMYHDQGLVPFKTITFEQGVNFTAGLPIVRTSPDHGTAFGIAGQGKASPGSMRSALFLAIDIARRRAATVAHEPS